MNSIKETLAKIVFLLVACVSILAVALICIFLFANGIPAMAEIGLGDFLLGTTWRPSNGLYGIFPMILGSVYVTAGAVLLAGIPSVVYGFFGLVVIVPLVDRLPRSNGSCILTASILLGIMILPTIITVSKSALDAVSQSYYEGSLALGATHERSVFAIMLLFTFILIINVSFSLLKRRKQV